MGLSCVLQMLNEKHAESLKKLLSRPDQPADDVAFISIDRLGTDVRVRHGNEYCVERLGFDFVSRPFSAMQAARLGGGVYA